MVITDQLAEDGSNLIEVYRGPVADGYKSNQRAVLATCGKHGNLIVGLNDLGRQLLRPERKPAQVLAIR
jgi:hypothetical protein